MKTASINLSKIDKSKIITGKNGDKYLNIVIWDNDEPDQFGNHFSIQQQLSKEEREAKVKAIYLGNGKDWSKEQSNDLDKATGGGDKVDENLPF